MSGQPHDERAGTVPVTASGYRMVRARPNTALYVGGMGAIDKNFYNQIFRQYGYEADAERIQQLFLSGRKSEAEAAILQSYLDALDNLLVKAGL